MNTTRSHSCRQPALPAVPGTGRAAAVQLLHQVPDIAERAMQQVAAQPPDRDASRHRELVPHRVVGRAHHAPVVQLARVADSDVGPGASDRRHRHQSQLVHRQRRPARGEQRTHLRRQRRRHDLVGVEVEHEIVPALVLAEPLLAPVAEPRLMHHAGALRARDRHRVVGRSAVDDDHLVDHPAHGGNGMGDVALLVQGPDEAGERRRCPSHGNRASINSPDRAS
jgi:hypothetical protein